MYYDILATPSTGSVNVIFTDAVDTASISFGSITKFVVLSQHVTCTHLVPRLCWQIQEAVAGANVNSLVGYVAANDAVP